MNQLTRKKLVQTVLTFVLLFAMALTLGGSVSAAAESITVNHNYGDGKTATTENEFTYGEKTDLTNWGKTTYDNEKYELYKIVIEKTPTTAKKLNYKIEYYKDSISSANLLGTKTATATSGDTITLTDEQLNAKRPASGYQEGVATPKSVKITKNNQVLQVLYLPVSSPVPAPPKKATLHIHFVNSVGAGNVPDEVVVLSDLEGADLKQNIAKLEEAYKPATFGDFTWRIPGNSAPYSFASTFINPGDIKQADKDTTVVTLSTTTENHLVLYYYPRPMSSKGEVNDDSSAVYKADKDKSQFTFSDVTTNNASELDVQKVATTTTEELTDDFHYTFKTGYTYKVTMYYKLGQNGPATGDNSNNQFYVMLSVLLASGVVLGLLTGFATERKRKRVK